MQFRRIENRRSGFIRFALVENQHRIDQAVRGIRKKLELS